MRARSAIIGVLAASAASAQLINRWVPGICSADQLTPSVGVGCGIIASDLKAYSPPSTASIRPIVQNVLCDLKCYFPGHETDPDCQYCVYVDHLHNDTAFKVPKNVFVMPWTGSSTCFENSVASSWDDVTTVVASSHEHNGFFHWSSTVTEKFLQRFFKSYASLSLFVQRYVFASIVLMPGQKLDQDFETRIGLLPTKFGPATKDNFFEFIRNYGTHYIDSAFTGGVAVLTSYFESCLSTTYSGQWVYHESGSSFFGIFNHDHKHESGYNHTSKMYQQNSNSTVNLYGGDGAKWGDFNWTRPVAANFSAAWAETIYTDQVPAIFHVQPMIKIFPPQYAAQAAALNASIQAYFDEVGANNTLKEKAMGPRVNPMPSWCKDSPDARAIRAMGEEGERLAAAAAAEASRLVDRGSAAPQAAPSPPPPLPKCPNMMEELEQRRAFASRVYHAQRERE